MPINIKALFCHCCKPSVFIRKPLETESLICYPMTNRILLLPDCNNHSPVSNCPLVDITSWYHNIRKQNMLGLFVFEHDQIDDCIILLFIWRWPPKFHQTFLCVKNSSSAQYIIYCISGTIYQSLTEQYAYQYWHQDTVSLFAFWGWRHDWRRNALWDQAITAQALGKWHLTPMSTIYRVIFTADAQL